MTEGGREQLDQRVLVLAPTSKDAHLTRSVLERAGVICVCCSTLNQVTDELEAGAGAVLLAEEAVSPATKSSLTKWVARQPPWSDLPVLVLARVGADSASVAQAMDLLGNVAVLERPMRVAALVSAVQTSLRARRRQYQAREHIVERERAEAELRVNDRRKDEFLAMLAHELRNPLAPIRNAAEILSLISEEPARVRETSEIIVRQARHMTEIVDDLLDVSRVTRGLVSLEKEVFDLRTIVMAAVEQSLPLIDERQHRLQLDLQERPAWVSGDRVRLTQVFSNLLNNAAKYTPPGGVIQVNFVDGPATVEVEVADTGEGIETELLPQIFDLFAQGRRTPDRAQGGLGIGLSLVKTLVHLHGGTVEAASAGRDRGSRFSVRLPVAQPPTSDTTANVGAAVRPPSASARPMQLLVVDDNLDAAESLATVLALDGHNVVKAHDAKGAMACARNQHLDAMMLDIGLPGIDGDELARRIRALPEVDGTLLIAVSGYGQLEDRRRAIEAGFDHYLVKPVDFDSLRSILRDSV